MDIKGFVKEVHLQIGDNLDERSRRLLMAAQANAIGRGGITIVANANKASRATITRGIQELSRINSAENEYTNRIRRKGGGRKKITDHK